MSPNRLVFFSALALVTAQTAVAQPARWHLIADGDTVHWGGGDSWPADSLWQAAKYAVQHLQNQGFLYARVDSHQVEEQGTALYVTRGERATVAEVRIQGASFFDVEDLLGAITTKPGSLWDGAVLDADAQTLVQVYSDQGYPFVRVRIADLDVLSPEPLRVAVQFEVTEGAPASAARVDLVGARRTGGQYVQRLSGLRSGRPIRRAELDRIRDRLADSGVFRSVGAPVLAVDADSIVVVQVSVEESPPGAFDLALGYERNRSGRGALVGTGSLELRNIFGGGRILSMLLTRAPGQTSKIDVVAHDPFIGGLPVSLGAQFNGLQQDSTYGKRAYALELGHRLERRLQVSGTVTREVTRPGQTGLAIVGGVQRIPVSTALFAGLGMRVSTIDNRVNPRRGVFVATTVESGRKDRQTRVVRADTTHVKTRVQQARLTVQARAFVPTASRQVLVLGGETRLLRSRVLDESDLFRFGGANTLRGYDEERFRAPFVARALAEYRYLVDASSHALVFFDLGYVDASRLRTPFRGFYPGYGLGFQLQTNAGLIKITAAAGTQAPTEVRVHLSVSLGL